MSKISLRTIPGHFPAWQRVNSIHRQLQDIRDAYQDARPCTETFEPMLKSDDVMAMMSNVDNTVAGKYTGERTNDQYLIISGQSGPSSRARSLAITSAWVVCPARR
jgi:hypothetical protein